MTRPTFAWWVVGAIALGAAVAAPSALCAAVSGGGNGLFLEPVGGAVSAPRIRIEHELNLPREMRAVRLLYVPDEATRGSITGVTWEGASAEGETAEGYTAKATLEGPGRHEVVVVVCFAASKRGAGLGRLPELERRIVLNGTEVEAAEVRARLLYPGTRRSPPVDLDGNLKVDEQDLAQFWMSYGSERGETEYEGLSDWDGDGAVGLSDLVEYCDAYEGWRGQDAAATYGSGHVYPVTIQNHYAFRVPAPLYRAQTEPAGFEPWVEWRVEGALWGTGATFTHAFEQPGEREVGAGVFGVESEARDLMVYRTQVAEFDRVGDIREGTTYTFEARTEPPGYENYVNWFASTMYGNVTQAYGRGRTFTVRFDWTWGPMPGDPSSQFQWLGVQADNVFFNQDQKLDPCTITITDCPAAWLPEGRQYGTAEGAPGNEVTFTATVQTGAPRKIRFFLTGVSSEPGVCINYGTETAKDLRFIQTATVNPAAVFDPPSADGLMIQTKNRVTQATVTVTCYDWGAWGKINACCLGLDDSSCEGVTPFKDIPIDILPPGGNHIADAWEPPYANQAATWDDDPIPDNMERNGDGFTFYEEYRGTMTGTTLANTDHFRSFPDRKDLFVHDPDEILLLGVPGQSYDLQTDIKVHWLQDPGLMNGTGSRSFGRRHVTWKSNFSHTNHQYALHLMKATLSGPSDWGGSTREIGFTGPGPPGTSLVIRVDHAQIATDVANAIDGQGGDHSGAEAGAYVNRRDGLQSAILTHEMGHGTDVEHHSVRASGVNPENPHCGLYGTVNPPEPHLYCGDPECFTRYFFDLVDINDTTHPGMFGIRTAVAAPRPPRWGFSNYTNKDLSDLLPLPHRFCTVDNDCRRQIDVKNP